jgi:transposase-like protein
MLVSEGMSRQPKKKVWTEKMDPAAVLQLEAEELIRSEIGKITTGNFQVAAERTQSHPHGGWYLRFSLSYRDVEELLVERGLDTDHVTVWRWMQRYVPELERLRAHLKPTNKSWRVDETYVRVKGKWSYLYRAVDSTGATIDFLLSAKRDTAAAKRFFQKALRSPDHPTPRVINVDKCPSYPAAGSNCKRKGNCAAAVDSGRCSI